MEDVPFAPEFLASVDAMIQTFSMPKGEARIAAQRAIQAEATLRGIDVELVADCATASKYPDGLRANRNRAVLKYMDQYTTPTDGTGE